MIVKTSKTNGKKLFIIEIDEKQNLKQICSTKRCDPNKQNVFEPKCPKHAFHPNGKKSNRKIIICDCVNRPDIIILANHRVYGFHKQNSKRTGKK